MSFFRRNQQPNGEDPSDVNALQAYEDQVLVSRDFLDGLLLDCDVAGIHPWDASDPTQLQAAWATTAYAQDRAAEFLMQAGLSEAGGQGNRVPADIEGFAFALSSNAQTRLEQAKQVDPATDTFEFTEVEVEHMHPEMQLPAWPAYADGTYDQNWQDRNAPPVSRAFLRAMIDAGEELHVQTYDTVQRFQLKVVQPVPDEFREFPTFVAEEICTAAASQLEAAKEFAYARADCETDMDIRASYDLVHEGYVSMMLAYVGVHAPRIVT